MRRIQAFFMALVLFVLFLAGFHLMMNRIDLRGGDGFRFFYSDFRNKSLAALTDNMDEDTMPIFGSSELGTWTDEPYHISHMFTRQQVNSMTVGYPAVQSLQDAISLGAIAGKKSPKKVTLLASPTWFSGTGVTTAAFKQHFSDTAYLALLKNDRLSAETRQKIAGRAMELAEGDAGLATRVKLYNRAYAAENASGAERIAADLLAMNRGDQENFAAAVLKLKNAKKADKNIGPEDATVHSYLKEDGSVDWERMKEQAIKDTASQSDNPLYVMNETWRKSYQKNYQAGDQVHKNEQWTSVREQEDFELFLQVAKELGIQTQVIILPVSGYWYDATGMPRANRDLVYQKIVKSAADYGAKCVDLSAHEYTPYFMADVYHPWSLGWTYISEAIYDFYKD